MKFNSMRNQQIVPTLGKPVERIGYGPVFPVKHIQPPTTVEEANPATIAAIMLRKYRALFSNKEDAESKFLYGTYYNQGKRPMDFSVARKVIKILRERKNATV